MRTSIKTIAEWLEEGKNLNSSHVIIVCDTFSYEDYPVYVRPSESVRSRVEQYQGKNMQKVMEVYNLSMDLGKQLNQKRAMNL